MSEGRNRQRSLHVGRRLVLAPAVVALTVLLWTTVPLWLVLAAVVSPWLPGYWRPLRLLWVAIAHLTLESLMLVEMFGLWIASGFGIFLRRPWFERVHYDLAQTYLVVLFREARRVLRLKITTVGPTPDAYPGEPLIVACRHAGPGDSFTLMYALMHWYGREPRVVLKDTMAWDPMVDVLLNRIPSRFISTNPRQGEDLESTIRDLATDLDENDAFVIFPEGGNFTENRRRRAIDKLRSLGHDRMAERAEGMAHVIAPRPGGLLAALEAAPDVDVLLVAHTGLDHLTTPGSLWRELPMDKQMTMGWWRVPREDVPDGHQERIDWLFSQWERIDDWVADNRPTDLPPLKPGARSGPRGSTATDS